MRHDGLTTIAQSVRDSQTVTGPGPMVSPALPLSSCVSRVTMALEFIFSAPLVLLRSPQVLLRSPHVLLGLLKACSQLSSRPSQVSSRPSRVSSRPSQVSGLSQLNAYPFLLSSRFFLSALTRSSCLSSSVVSALPSS